MEPCKHRELCGGCVYQGIEYGEQAAKKEKEVLKLLADKEIVPENYLGMEPSPMIYRYRNKMEYTFGDMEKGGEMTLGMHQRGKFMSIITVDDCQLVTEDFNLILRTVLDYFKQKGVQAYHKKKHFGFLRNLILRRGQNTGELLVNLVTTSAEMLDAEDFVRLILGLPLTDSVVGILHTINDDIADAVRCQELRVLYGRDYYNEVILGLKFKVSAFSFFQTNISAVERLYGEALDMTDDFQGMTVFDLYCGTGTISQALALKAKQVIGVEIVEEAVEAAKMNAAENGLTNVAFIAGDVLKVIDEIEEKPDMIVLDPPRMGIHYKALPKIINYGVNQILYISCNPKTMMDNLKFAELHGYKIEKLKAYDNFPFTQHVETVCLLINQNVKLLHYVNVGIDTEDYYRMKENNEHQER